MSLNNANSGSIRREIGANRIQKLRNAGSANFTSTGRRNTANYLKTNIDPSHLDGRSLYASSTQRETDMFASSEQTKSQRPFSKEAARQGSLLNEIESRRQLRG